MTLQALLDNGDEVLIPAPDYPLWTASTSLAGGTPVHYLCDETQGWQPDIADLESKITDRTKAIVVINPNNPTGRGVLPRGPRADRRPGPQAPAAAARRRDLRQDPLRRRRAHRDGLAWRPTCLPDLQRPVQGLPGGRATGPAGWSSPARRSTPSSFIEGISLLANMRLCPNVPAQHAIQVALGGHQSIDDLVLPGGRLLEQRDVAWTSSTRSPACPA